MRVLPLLLSCATAVLVAGDSNLTSPLSSRIQLPSTFKPAQVFKNTNLVRSINLEKGYVKENINVIIENVDPKKEAQAEYYVPFDAETISKIGGIEVRDRKDAEAGPFVADVVEYDPYSPTQFIRILLPTPLKHASQQTLSISYTILSALTPKPAQIAQMDKQYLLYTFSAYSPSAYTTLQQKTKLKLPTTDIPDYTILPKANSEGKEDPSKQGKEFTYGPYSELPAGAVELVSVRYEFTKPVLHATKLERNVEISHWGGNINTEEQYFLTNIGAALKGQFSRVQWQMTNYAKPPTSAVRELSVPLKAGSSNPYFVDDIGNVSTSHFRSGVREALLELRPRYPVFGDWKYKFKIGWDADSKDYLRKLSKGDGYVLRLPFLEGPRMPEGTGYGRVDLRVILPEGSTNVKFSTPVPLVSNTTTLYKSYMDTLGRTTLHLTAMNLNDEWRDREVIVTYDYPFSASFRKPLTFVAAMTAIFGVAYVVGGLNLSIGKKGPAIKM